MDISVVVLFLILICILWMYNNLLLSSLIDGRWVFSTFWLVLKKTAGVIHAQIFNGCTCLFLLGKCLGMDFWVTCMFKFKALFLTVGDSALLGTFDNVWKHFSFSWLWKGRGQGDNNHHMVPRKAPYNKELCAQKYQEDWPWEIML